MGKNKTKEQAEKRKEGRTEGKKHHYNLWLLLSITFLGNFKNLKNKLLSRWKYPFFFSIGCTEAGLKPNQKHAQTAFSLLLLQLSIMSNLLPTTKTNSSEEVSNTVFLTSEKFWNESSYHKVLASPLPFSLWRFSVKKQLVRCTREIPHRWYKQKMSAKVQART